MLMESIKGQNEREIRARERGSCVVCTGGQRGLVCRREASAAGMKHSKGNTTFLPFPLTPSLFPFFFCHSAVLMCRLSFFLSSCQVFLQASVPMPGVVVMCERVERLVVFGFFCHLSTKWTCQCPGQGVSPRAWTQSREHTTHWWCRHSALRVCMNVCVCVLVNGEWLCKFPVGL